MASTAARNGGCSVPWRRSSAQHRSAPALPKHLLQLTSPWRTCRTRGRARTAAPAVPRRSRPLQSRTGGRRSGAAQRVGTELARARAPASGASSPAKHPPPQQREQPIRPPTDEPWLFYNLTTQRDPLPRNYAAVAEINRTPARRRIHQAITADALTSAPRPAIVCQYDLCMLINL